MHLDPAVVPIEHRCGTSPTLSRCTFSLRTAHRNTLSRRDRTWHNVRPALRSNLFFYSHLRSARSRSLVYGTGRSNSPRGLSIHLRERASERTLAIPVDRFFVEDARPRIKSRESRRGGRRAAATDPEAAATGRSVERSPPLVRRTIRLRTLRIGRLCVLRLSVKSDRAVFAMRLHRPVARGQYHVFPERRRRAESSFFTTAD